MMNAEKILNELEEIKQSFNPFSSQDNQKIFWKIDTIQKSIKEK